MKNHIINSIRDNLLAIIPELAGEDLSNNTNLRDLGANSVDRGELITFTLERLNIDISRIEFEGLQSIEEITDLITEKIL